MNILPHELRKSSTVYRPRPVCSLPTIWSATSWPGSKSISRLSSRTCRLPARISTTTTTRATRLSRVSSIWTTRWPTCIYGSSKKYCICCRRKTT